MKPGDNLTELAREFDSTQLALLDLTICPMLRPSMPGWNGAFPMAHLCCHSSSRPIPFSGSHFVVSLSRQQCWVLEGNNVRYSWSCSTGYGK